MPLDIIRNDITRVKADAIVNTANPHVAIGSGTDTAIYEAAGREQLLAERAKIGEMRPGQAAYTPAFNLPAKYIIHTVGPAWRGGRHHERETVAQCYRECLGIAAALECETVAFPLLSSGNYGFPKDEALKIAISEISSFLFEHEMTVLLVVYDKESFVVSGKAFANVKSFIAENEVRSYSRGRGSNIRSEADGYDRGRSRRSEKGRKLGSRIKDTLDQRSTGALPLLDEEAKRLEAPTTDDYEGEEWLKSDERLRRTGDFGGFDGYFDELLSSSYPDDEDLDTMPHADYSMMPDAVPEAAPKSMPDAVPRAVPKSKSKPAPRALPKSSSGKPAPKVYSDVPAPTAGYKEITIDDIIKMKGDTFQQVLFKIIDRKGMTDPEVYKKSNIDRKLFSKIRSNVDYTPSKNTVMALIIGLELNIDEATDLLQRAGYSFSPGSVSDLTIQSCVMQHLYDIHTINCFLFDLGQKPLV
jgi:O-acetyl-ADP-ribose deacetylase (regulator of RNase III)